MNVYCPVCARIRKVDDYDQRCKTCGFIHTRPMCRKCNKRVADCGGLCINCESIKMDAELEMKRELEE